MDTFIRVQGIVSKAAEKTLTERMDAKWPAVPGSLSLFVDAADVDIPLGTTFTCLVEKKQGSTRYAIQGKLIQVSQQFALPYHHIPRGLKTICEIKLDDASKKILAATIPVTEHWQPQDKVIVLGV